MRQARVDGEGGSGARQGANKILRRNGRRGPALYLRLVQLLLKILSLHLRVAALFPPSCTTPAAEAAKPTWVPCGFPLPQPPLTITTGPRNLQSFQFYCPETTSTLAATSHLPPSLFLHPSFILLFLLTLFPSCSAPFDLSDPSSSSRGFK